MGFVYLLLLLYILPIFVLKKEFFFFTFHISQIPLLLLQYFLLKSFVAAKKVSFLVLFFSFHVNLLTFDEIYNFFSSSTFTLNLSLLFFLSSFVFAKQNDIDSTEIQFFFSLSSISCIFRRWHSILLQLTNYFVFGDNFCV